MVVVVPLVEAAMVAVDQVKTSYPMDSVITDVLLNPWDTCISLYSIPFFSQLTLFLF